MAVDFSDSFNRANSGSLGGSWTNLGASPTIVSNQCAMPSSAAVSYWNGGTPAADCYAKATSVTTVGSPSFNGVFVRLNTSTFNWYAAEWNSSVCSILRYDGGVPTGLGSTGFAPPSNGDVVELRIVGSTLTLYYNGTLQETRTDSTYSASGRAGVAGAGTSNRLDSFETGTPSTDTPITVTASTLTLAGASVTLTNTTNATVPVTAGVLAVSGSTVTLTNTDNSVVAVTTASLSLSGSSISFVETANYILPVTAASLSLSGSTVTLTAVESFTLPVTAGSLTLTSSTVGLVAVDNYILPVTADSLSLSGSSITLTWTDNSTLAVTAGSLTLAGATVSLNATAGTTLPVTAASLTLAGSTVTFAESDNTFITVDAGSLSLTGQTVAFIDLANSVLTVDSGALALSGSSISFVETASYTIEVVPASMSVNAADIDLLSADNQSLSLSPNSLALSGSTVGLTTNTTLSVLAAALNLQGEEVVFDQTTAEVLVVVARALQLIGSEVSITDDTPIVYPPEVIGKRALVSIKLYIGTTEFEDRDNWEYHSIHYLRELAHREVSELRLLGYSVRSEYTYNNGKTENRFVVPLRHPPVSLSGPTPEPTPTPVSMSVTPAVLSLSGALVDLIDAMNVSMVITANSMLLEGAAISLLNSAASSISVEAAALALVGESITLTNTTSSAPSIVQKTPFTNRVFLTTSTTLEFLGAITTGSKLVLALSVRGDDGHNVEDVITSLSMTGVTWDAYSGLSIPTFGDGQKGTIIYTGTVTSGGATTVTANFNTGNCYLVGMGFEIDPVGTPTPYTTTVGESGNGTATVTATASGALPSALNKAFAVSFADYTGTDIGWNTPAGWTLEGSQASGSAGNTPVAVFSRDYSSSSSLAVTVTSTQNDSFGRCVTQTIARGT